MSNQFRNRIDRFLYGRYGTDALYNVLFIIVLVLLFLGAVLNTLGRVVSVLYIVSIVLYVAALGLLIFALFRFFSRNLAARRRENDAWLRFRARFRRKPKPRLPADTADHIFRACPRCRATLRLPRQPGKHEVKCPRCNDRFTVKVKSK